MNMKVENIIEAYEKDGIVCTGLNGPVLKIKAHWNRSNMVVIEWPNGQALTVAESELRAALSNATNKG